MADAREVPRRVVETEAPLRGPILGKELLSGTASGDGLPELFMVQGSRRGRLFAPR